MRQSRKIKTYFSPPPLLHGLLHLQTTAAAAAAAANCLGEKGEGDAPTTVMVAVADFASQSGGGGRNVLPSGGWTFEEKIGCN